MPERIHFSDADYRKCPGYGTEKCCGTCHQNKINTYEDQSKIRVDFVDQEKTSVLVPLSQVNEVYMAEGEWVSIAKESAQIMNITEDLDRITQESIDRVSAIHSEIILTPFAPDCPMKG